MFESRRTLTHTFARRNLAVLLGKKKRKVELIAVIHHGAGICFIETFWAWVTTVREEPQLIRDTAALSWRFYLWEHCFHTCHCRADCHHRALHPSIHSHNCRRYVYSFGMGWGGGVRNLCMNVLMILGRLKQWVDVLWDVSTYLYYVLYYKLPLN